MFLIFISFSVSLACFSTFSGAVVCISPFVFYMYRYLSFSFYRLFMCVSRELSHLSALCRVAMFTRLDWLSGITWDGLTRMVCAFPLQSSRGNCSLEQWACRKVGACQKVGGVPKGFSLVKRKLGGVPKGFAKAGCSA